MYVRVSTPWEEGRGCENSREKSHHVNFMCIFTWIFTRISCAFSSELSCALSREFYVNFHANFTWWFFLFDSFHSQNMFTWILSEQNSQEFHLEIVTWMSRSKWIFQVKSTWSPFSHEIHVKFFLCIRQSHIVRIKEQLEILKYPKQMSNRTE